VTYYANGAISGSVPTDSNSYQQGATVTILGNTGNLIGSSLLFAGWNTKADGSGTNYAAGAKLSMGTANVTLYAIWWASYAFYLTDPNAPNYLMIQYYDPNASENLGVHVYDYAMTNGDEVLVLDKIVNGLLPGNTQSIVYLDSHSHWVSQIKGTPLNITIEGLIDCPSGLPENSYIRQLEMKYGQRNRIMTELDGTDYWVFVVNGKLENGTYVDYDGTIYDIDQNGNWTPRPG
jgi:hypothetical protein